MEKFLTFVFVTAVLGGFVCAGVLFYNVHQLKQEAAAQQKIIDAAAPPVKVRAVTLPSAEDPYSTVNAPQRRPQTRPR